MLSPQPGVEPLYPILAIMIIAISHRGGEEYLLPRITDLEFIITNYDSINKLLENAMCNFADPPHPKSLSLFGLLCIHILGMS